MDHDGPWSSYHLTLMPRPPPELLCCDHVSRLRCADRNWAARAWNCSLHNPSPSLSIVHLCFGGLGPYCGGLYCVFSKAWCDTSEWFSIPVCGLGMSSGQVGIKVLDLVAKWALPCEPVCQVWQVKIFLLRPWVPSKVTASILLADPFGLSFCGSQPKNHVICPSKVCSRESESAWTLFVLPLFRRSTSCCDVMSRNLRGCEMSSRLYIGCIRVVAFCSSNSQKIKDWYSIATIAGWKKIEKISWKYPEKRWLSEIEMQNPLGAVSGKKLKAETSHAWADGQLLNRTYRRRSAINQSVL